MATASASDTVNTKLSKHRAQIEDLNNIRSLLKKLQASLAARSRAPRPSGGTARSLCLGANASKKRGARLRCAGAVRRLRSLSFDDRTRSPPHTGCLRPPRPHEGRPRDRRPRRRRQGVCRARPPRTTQNLTAPSCPRRLTSSHDPHSAPPLFAPPQAALPLLERYGTGAFATVKAETASTVKDIGDRLRNTLRNAHTSPDDAAEALELLQMLKMPQDELQREWLSERRKALADAMRHAGEQFWAAHTREHARGQPGQPPAPRHSADVHDFVRHVDRGFLQELIKTVNQYKDVRCATRPFPRTLHPSLSAPPPLASRRVFPSFPLELKRAPRRRNPETRSSSRRAARRSSASRGSRLASSSRTSARSSPPPRARCRRPRA